MNVFRNRYRRAALGARKTLSLAPNEDAFATVEDRDVVVRALRGLTRDQRAAVVLTGYVGLTSEEAGKDAGYACRDRPHARDARPSRDARGGR
jgi:DNA-directed RNA polymerase specialized sigma24 family protein